ncbi:MAG: asparagine synthase (glutamine-hydrolyzing) [Candidatus Ancaeobacter aquaticus]|nr:asparagine synthase (glutamine-hydrolyzing) [Candidatus Ancaeobacter aquaticus]
MCGICGIALHSQQQTFPSETLHKMNESIYHRGPDSDGVFIHNSIGIAMRRLSIIDVDGGKQPIFNEDKTIAVVFNGEIYNFLELRNDLERKGHIFLTKTDSETIVHLYEEYGMDFPQYLRGMFAIALHDTKSKKLILIRDRIGIKPLYYSYSDSYLVFGSEMKCILNSGLVNKKINPCALDDYFSFNYTASPQTIFSSIKSLMPGHMLISQNRRVDITCYWDLLSCYKNNKIQTQTNTDELYITDKVYSLLKDAVREELISDVPLGAFLSGGIDSSTVVAIMSELIGDNVKTFSIGFDNAAYNELSYAREIATLYKTDHHEFKVKPDMIDLLPKLVEYLDEPFADSSIVPTYIVSQLTRQHVTVALSGDGGDEFFGGYSWTKANLLLNRYRMLPLFIRRGLSASIKSIPINTVFMDKLVRMALSGADDLGSGFLRRITCFDNALKSNLYNKEFCKDLSGYSSYDTVLNKFNEAKDLDPLSAMLYVDASLYLPDDTLKKVDRMSMANSLEVRVPFLDHRVMEYATSIQSHYKINGLTTKYIIKKAFSDKLPKRITKQRKSGFSIPIHDWFRNELKVYAKEILLDKNARLSEYLNHDFINTLLESHQNGKRNLGHHIFSLLMLELWLQKYQ